jgi:hypothetical protein
MKNDEQGLPFWVYFVNTRNFEKCEKVGVIVLTCSHGRTAWAVGLLDSIRGPELFGGPGITVSEKSFRVESWVDNISPALVDAVTQSRVDPELRRTQLNLLGGVTIFRVRIRVWIRIKIRVWIRIKIRVWIRIKIRIKIRVRVKFKIQKITKL